MKFSNFTKAIFLIIVLIFMCACQKNYINKTVPIEHIKVDTVQADNYKNFHGFIKSQLISDLSFQTEGRIIFMPYTKGDFVKKGQVLARLDGVLYKIKKSEEQANLQNAIVQYNKARSTFRRMDILHKEGGVSDNEWEDSYFDLKAYAEQIRVQKEKIKYLDKEISYNIIIAPYDGFIAQKISEVGSYAKVGEAVMTISGSDKTQVEVMVDSSVINKINLDEKVSVFVNNKQYEGKIAHISKTSLNEGGYLVKIYLDNLYSELKDGMSADVKISFNDSTIVYIPLDSVFELDNQKYVYRVDSEGVIKKEKIKTGEILDEKIEVIEGLESGDTIISKGTDRDLENMKIKI